MRPRLPLALLLSALPLLHCAPSSSDGDDSDDALSANDTCSTQDCVRHSEPRSSLTYDDLVTLSGLEGVRAGATYKLTGAPAGLEGKINDVMNTPTLDNAAWYAGKRAYRPVDTARQLGTTLRAAQWNIERGENLPAIIDMLRAAGGNDAAFRARLDPSVSGNPGTMTQLKSDLAAIANTDVFLLNEVDNGMIRTGYANVVDTLAKELGMNYAYSVEFVEVDPMVLGKETLTRDHFGAVDKNGNKIPEDPNVLDALAKEANDAMDAGHADTAKIKGLHGNAVLSRYPILKARIVPFTATRADGCWDWNADEKKKNGFADAVLRAGQNVVTEKVFLEETQRQLRHGGRGVLMVDLKVAGLDTPVTVVNAHLEARGTSQCRRKQMAQVLDLIKANTNPVVMGGDFNSAGNDGRPQTVRSLLASKFKSPEFYLKQIIPRLLPYSAFAFTVFDGIKLISRIDDPTSMFNPEHAMFDDIKNAGFDFRGEKLRTVNGTEKTLANSNERDAKGFKTTFSWGRTFGPIGKFKLDWLLVRSYATNGTDKKSYKFAPHFPQTLETLDTATTLRMSDHYPTTVTLPLGDPCLGRPAGTCTLAVDDPGTDDFHVSAN